MKSAFLTLVLALATLLTSCAQLVPQKQPEVSLIAIKRLEPNGFEQRFLIQLRLHNPNKQSLPLEGLHYRLSLNGQPLVEGDSGALPPIAGLSDVPVELEARLNLISALGQLASLLSRPQETLNYQLEADLRLRHLPDMRVTKSGAIALQ